MMVMMMVVMVVVMVVLVEVMGQLVLERLAADGAGASVAVVVFLMVERDEVHLLS